MSDRQKAVFLFDELAIFVRLSGLPVCDFLSSPIPSRQIGIKKDACREVSIVCSEAVLYNDNFIYCYIIA